MKKKCVIPVDFILSDVKTVKMTHFLRIILPLLFCVTFAYGDALFFNALNSIFGGGGKRPKTAKPTYGGPSSYAVPAMGSWKPLYTDANRRVEKNPTIFKEASLRSL